MIEDIEYIILMVMVVIPIINNWFVEIIVEFVRLVILVVIVIPNISQHVFIFIPNQLQGIPKSQKSYFYIPKYFRYNNLFRISLISIGVRKVGCNL